MGFTTGTLFLNTGKNDLQDAQLFMSVGFFSVLIQVRRRFLSVKYLHFNFKDWGSFRT